MEALCLLSEDCQVLLFAVGVFLATLCSPAPIVSCGICRQYGQVVGDPSQLVGFDSQCTMMAGQTP